MMPRLFWDRPVSVGQTLSVTGEDGHHFARVLRAAPGETATVAAQGRGYLARVTSVDAAAGTLRLTVVEALRQRDPNHKIYLVQALAKSDKIETIVQKCTEVGVAGILLYESARCVMKLPPSKRDAKVLRWNKVAREAAIQCQRDTIPVVEFTGAFRQGAAWLKEKNCRRILLLDEQEKARGLRDILRGDTFSGGASHRGTAVAVAVGPEGGWDETDRALWSAAGAVPATLGPRILRTETAGVVALTAILYETGDLGG